MRKFGRREGNENKSKSKLRHGLSVVVFDHQDIYRNVKPFLSSLNNAAVSLANWSLREENVAVQDACTKMYEISCITSTIFEEFFEEYLTLGCSLKELVCQEINLANLNKKVCQAEEKVAKLRNQNMVKEAKEKEKKKDGAGFKRLSLLEDLGNAELLYEEQKASFHAQTTKHEILKAKCLRESLIQLAEGTAFLAKRLSTISHAENELAKAIPIVPTQITGDEKYQGTEYFDEIVQEAADALNITRPLAFNESQTRKNDSDRKPDAISCFSAPPSPNADQDWVIVDPTAYQDANQTRFDLQMLTSLKKRLVIQNSQGRSYISNRRIEEGFAAKYHGLQSDITNLKKTRPPVPLPRFSPPRSAPPHRPSVKVQALVDFPRVEPYAVSRRQPNNQGLYARADLYDRRRLCRSWSGESAWWTGEEREMSDEDNGKDVVYAVLEREDNEETLSNNKSDYVDVLQ